MIRVNDKNFVPTKFPNNEKLLPVKNYLFIKDKNEIEFKFEDDSDFITLMHIKKHIDDKVSNSYNTLIIPYLPYSRMDRTEGINIFTLKNICSFINDLNFDKVIVYEPHSDVSVALLDRVEVVDSSVQILNKTMDELNFSSNYEDYIFFPDAGALKRYSKQISYNKVLSANKERDFVSGKIKNLTITGNVPTNPFRAIIVDDLCSRGGTFIQSAEKLREIGATEVYLVVTHCENTIFDGDIFKTDLINKVYTTDSILDINNITKDIENKINVINIF